MDLHLENKQPCALYSKIINGGDSLFRNDYKYNISH